MKKSSNFVSLFILFSAAVISVIGASFLCDFLKLSGIFKIIIPIIITAIVLIILLIISHNKESDTELPADVSDINSITHDYILKMDQPVVISELEGKIIWYNKAFSEGYNNQNLYGKNVNDVLESDVLDSSEDKKPFVSFSDSLKYRASKQIINFGTKSFYIISLVDVTEFVELKNTHEELTPALAYIMIDNTDELQQVAGGSYRNASAQVAEIIKKWVEESGGFFLEYERDRFIYLFNSKILNTFTDNGFSVLEKFREIKIDNGRLPVTVSMGISSSYNLQTAESAAKSAMDMALQRGGDQVVVKIGPELSYYGGKTQTVPKRTTVKSRVFTDQLLSNISSSSNVLIMGHTHPDYDSIGACLGISAIADFCNIESRIIINKKDLNLVKMLDVLDSDRKTISDSLFCTPGEAMDLLTSDTLTIVCDTNNVSRFASKDVYDNSYRVMVIDHHRRIEEYEREHVYSYIDPSSSSACELVSEFLELATDAGYLNSVTANALLSGIVLDTKNFSQNTGSRTFGAAQYLRNEGALPTEVNYLFKSDINEFLGEAMFESNFIVYRGIIAIASSDNDEISTDRISAAKAADKLLTVENIRASFTLFEENNTVHISARSDGSLNVQLILEKLGGGGRYDAAATQISGSHKSDALHRLKNAIDEYLEEISSD